MQNGNIRSQLIFTFVMLFSFVIVVQQVFGLAPSQMSLSDVELVKGMPDVSAESEQSELLLLTEDRNCRYGVAAWGQQQFNWLPTLQVGWYFNFGVSAAGSAVSNVEFVQVVRINQARDGNGNRLPDYVLWSPTTHAALANAVAANPGSLWLIGNEPDRVFWQDDIYPDVYAKAYHELYHLIKSTDPTAKVAIAGLVEVTPARLQYLDIVWDSYIQRYGTPMPVDVWNMHIYILPEARINEHGQLVGSRAGIALGTDPSLAILESDLTPNLCHLDSVYCYAEHDSIPIFISQVRAMRTWMKNKGQQNKPLILSEYSLLYPFAEYDDPVNPTTCFLMDEYGNCFTQARVREYMLQTFNHLESAADPSIGYPLDNNRLVQQWLWYAVHDSTEGSPNRLVNSELTQLTEIGQAFANHISSQPLYVNLTVEQVPSQAVFTTAPDNTAEATLLVKFRNNGNTAVNAPFTVTFYSDAHYQQPIGSVTIPAGMGGCARDSYEAAIVWSGLTPGMYPFWVAVDSEHVIVETSQSDNYGNGFVLVNPEQNFLPILRR